MSATRRTEGSTVPVGTKGRRLRLLAVALLAALAGGVFLAVPHAGSQAATEEGEVPVDREGWYWRDNQKTNPPGTGQQQETFPAAAQKDHLQVQLENGEDDKRTYLGFDTSGLDGFEGSTVRGFALTIEVSRSGEGHSDEHREEAEESSTPFFPPATSNDEAAQLVGCPVTTFFAGGADGDPRHEDADGDPTTSEQTRVEPEFDCDLAMGEGVRADDGSTWTLDLTDVAQIWADGETIDRAVALTPSPDSPSAPPNEANWTIEFHGKALDGIVESTISYTPEGASQPAFFADEGDGTDSADDTGGTQVGGGTTAPPPSTGRTGGAGTSPVSTPAPTGDEGSAEATSQPVAQPPSEPVSSGAQLTWYAILVWPLGLLALGAAYTALRDEETGAASTHRVASLLRGRGAGAIDQATAPPTE